MIKLKSLITESNSVESLLINYTEWYRYNSMWVKSKSEKECVKAYLKMKGKSQPKAEKLLINYTEWYLHNSMWAKGKSEEACAKGYIKMNGKLEVENLGESDHPIDNYSKVKKKYDKELKQLEKLMKSQDWYYDRSDDHGRYMDGSKSRQNLVKLTTKLNDLGLEKETMKLWKRYNPAQK